MHLYALIIEPFVSYGFMRRALVACLALSLGSGPVGVFLVLRRMSLMGDAMSHAVLPGAALGFLAAGLSLGAMSAGGLLVGLTVAILAGFSSVILVMLLGQSRVFFAMSRDGLVPPLFAEVHPKYRTPWKSNVVFFVLTALFAAFVPGNIVGEMTSIGTLFAFILVCAGVWLIRVRRPEIPRGFVVPALPLVSTLGIVVCGAMIYGLGWTNWLRLAAWLVVGLFLYFGYARRHSRLSGYAEERT